MNVKSFLYIPLCAMVAVVMNSCSDELETETGNSNRPHSSNGIVFGTSVGYTDGNSRTSYGDDWTDIGGTNYQELRWEEGDRVDIYSPQSPTKKLVEYETGNIGGADGTGDQGLAYLAAIGGQDGLQWGAESTQDFYAIYPSKNSITNSAVRERVNFDSSTGVFTGYVPINQQHTLKKSGKVWSSTPNMDYCYMAAINEGFQVPTDGTDGGVTLDFIPLVTTLEVTIEGPTVNPLASMNIQANGVAVAGNFSYDFLNGERDGEGYPMCKSTQGGTTNDYITVSLYGEGEDETQVPLTLAEGESATFNVFLLPTAPLNNVTIRIAGFNTSSRTMSLGGNISLSPHKKTRITIPAPQISPGELNEWITGLEDDVLVSQLSIPGTANSFSYVYDGNNKATYSAQTANFETQWNAGIRCFELTGAEYSITIEEGNWWENDKVIQETVTDLNGAALLCNREPIGMTFGEAVDMIWNKVNNTGEFAMIIPSYDSNTGHPSNHNGVESYANALNAFFDSHQYDYVTYNRDLTVGEARGKLIFIARITSEEDGDEYTLPEPHQGVFVDQWGSLKDNWARRGYTLSDGTVVNNWSTGTGDTNSMEYYMNTRSSSKPSYLPSRQESNVDFIHTTTREGGSKGIAYIQDWQRVVPRNGVSGLRPGSFTLQEASWRDEGYYTYWEESLTEKENAIWDTFEKAIDANSGQQADEFYINSLDGYFVDPNIAKSYKPYVSGGTWGVGLSDGGTEGNIDAYATYINNWFYNQILDYGEDNIYGPMNIVLMDRVYEEGGGSYLPSVIINNNYRFPLVVKGGGTTDPSTQSKADGSYSAGGSVWK